MSESLIYAVGSLGVLGFAAAAEVAWRNVKRETGLTFRQWLRLNTLGYVESEEGYIMFLCDKHGFQYDLKRGYTDIFGAHSLVLSGGYFCDCPMCLKEREEATV